MKSKLKGATAFAQAAALIALACAISEPEMVWYKPGVTDADFYRMRGYCVNQAGVGVLPASTATVRYVACMQSDGWVQVPKEKAEGPMFSWVRSDGMPAPRAELGAAKAECQASAGDAPGSALYGTSARFQGGLGSGTFCPFGRAALLQLSRSAAQPPASLHSHTGAAQDRLAKRHRSQLVLHTTIAALIRRCGGEVLDLSRWKPRKARRTPSPHHQRTRPLAIERIKRSGPKPWQRSNRFH